MSSPLVVATENVLINERIRSVGGSIEPRHYGAVSGLAMSLLEIVIGCLIINLDKYFPPEPRHLNLSSFTLSFAATF
jgi:hypothetical protein